MKIDEAMGELEGKDSEGFDQSTLYWIHDLKKKQGRTQVLEGKHDQMTLTKMKDFPSKCKFRRQEDKP